MNKTERLREQHHAQLRTVEVELHNTLASIDGLVGRVSQAVKARDCKTARLNFDQAAIAFKQIGRKLGKAGELHKRLRLSPGMVAPPGSVDVHTAAPTPTAKPEKKPAKPARAEKKPAKPARAEKKPVKPAKVEKKLVKPAKAEKKPAKRGRK